MLRDQPIINTLLINLLLGAVWHYATFFLCISINISAFDPKRRIYQPHKWEKEGKFYNDVLKINKWKDFLPQHIGKDGFSKDHIDDFSIEYIDEFILETCRGEWNHSMNCVFAVVLMIINNFTIGIILTILLWLGNMPFAIIQRYNRFRLQKLRKTLVRKQERANRKNASVAVSVNTIPIGEKCGIKDDDTVN